MKAVVKSRAEPGLWLEEVPVPEVKGDNVLIRVLKTSICGTDVHIYNWDAWAQKTIPVPMTIGHEFVGVIHAVGDHVKGFAPGDLVTVEGHITCGHCRNCLAGRRHLCPNTQGVGVNRPGAWAEFVSIPQSNLWHADSSISLDVLSCFDPLGNAVHTALSFDLSAKTFSSPVPVRSVAWLCRSANKRALVMLLSPISIPIGSIWQRKWGNARARCSCRKIERRHARARHERRLRCRTGNVR